MQQEVLYQVFPKHRNYQDELKLWLTFQPAEANSKITIAAVIKNLI